MMFRRSFRRSPVPPRLGPTGRATSAAAIAILLSGTLASCAPAPNPRLTAQEGRDAVVDLVLGTVKALGGKDFLPVAGVAWAQDCKFADGDIGAAYGYSQTGPRGVDREADAKAVAKYWKSLGMTTTIVTTTPYPTVYGNGGRVLRASFDTAITDDLYDIGATAPCSTGDAYDINVADDAQRDCGVILPGDDGVVDRSAPIQLYNTPEPTPECTITPRPTPGHAH